MGAQGDVPDGKGETISTSTPGSEKTSLKTLRKIKKALGHLGLFLALMLYTIIGGIVFKELEYPSEVAELTRLEALVSKARGDFIEAVTAKWKERKSWREEMADLDGGEDKDFLHFFQKELGIYEEGVQEAAEGGVLIVLSGSEGGKNPRPEELAKWSPAEGIFFASTVLTTIGYGNIVPVTVAGRVFCILFAIIGIPLALTVIADVGCLFASSLPSLPNWLSLPDPGGGGGDDQGATGQDTGRGGHWRSLLTATAALALLIGYMAVGAALFVALEEGWDFFSSFYFCFVTMTTIGFGDLVPQKPQYMFLCTLYILVGLSLTSTIIELVRLEYVKSWERLRALAEALKKLGEEGGGGSVDLKKLSGLVSSGKSISAKEWESRMRDMVKSVKREPKPQPRVIQIIVYETSV